MGMRWVGLGMVLFRYCGMVACGALACWIFFVMRAACCCEQVVCGRGRHRNRSQLEHLRSFSSSPSTSIFDCWGTCSTISSTNKLVQQGPFLLNAGLLSSTWMTSQPHLLVTSWCSRPSSSRVTKSLGSVSSTIGSFPPRLPSSSRGT
jgi:hypothetical protein